MCTTLERASPRRDDGVPTWSRPRVELTPYSVVNSTLDVVGSAYVVDLKG